MWRRIRAGDSSAIDGRTTRHAGYAVSQRIRKRIEEAFGWIKMVAGLEQTKFRGCDRVGCGFQLRRHRLQSDAAAEAVGRGMSAPSNCQLNRRDRQGRICGLATVRAREINTGQSALFFNGLLDWAGRCQGHRPGRR